MKKGVLGIIVCLVISICNVSIVYAEDPEKNDQNSNLIYIVYDDSGSMYLNDIDNPTECYNKWAQAKYSISTFANMMGENDKMEIYSLSGSNDESSNYEPCISIEGNENSTEKITKIESNLNNSYDKNTKFETVERVAQRLKKDSNNSAKKWLIVITDGFFQKNKKEIKNKDELESNFKNIIHDKDEDETINKNINYVYLNIGNESLSLPDNMDENFYTYSAENTENSDILKGLTKIANLIFKQQNLNDFSQKDNKVTFNIDAPIKKIIVFAQGQNTKIGQLKYKGKKSKNYEYSDIVDFKGPSEENIPDGIKKIVNNNNLDLNGLLASDLQGQITTYSLENDNQFKLGDYELEVENSTELQIYYELDVDLGLNLFQINDDGDDIPINNKSRLIDGEKVHITTEWLNHKTKKKVESKLIGENNINYSITVYNNGETLGTYTENDIITDKLGKGNLEIEATATFSNNISLSSNEKTKVYKIIKTEQKFKGFEDEVRIDKIDNHPINLTITKENGETFTKEEWKKLKVTVERHKDLDIKITKENDKKTCTLKINSVPEGNTKLKVNVQGVNDTIIYEGTDTYEIKVRGLTVFEMFWKWFPIVVVILTILTLLFFYFKTKARIPRKLRATIQRANGAGKPSKCSIKKIEHNINPFKDAMGMINIRFGNEHFTDFYIKAEKNGKETKFYISNIDRCIDDDSYTLHQNTVTDIKNSISYKNGKYYINNYTQFTLTKKDNGETYRIRFIINRRR